MTLSDSEILELNELCSAVIDDTLTDEQQPRLAHFLASSEEARQFYVRITGLSASLFYYAGEMQTEPRDANASSHPLRHFRWIINTLAIAACIALIFLMFSSHFATSVTKASPAEVQFVACISGSKDCRWAKSPLGPGARIAEKQSLELAGGFAEITFDSGAKVILQGPATLVANSAWSASLSRGTLKAIVTPEAVGFSIANPTVKVVDLGAEFIMSADPAGSADVLVLKGQVEATWHTSTDQQPLLLNAGESRRFASSGISPIPDSAANFDKWAGPLSLDHFVAPIGYAHWSFDETTGSHFSADAIGLDSQVSPAEIQNAPLSAISGLHTRGRWNGALNFSGHSYVRIPFPSISEDSPHTVAFWVKIPHDASLSNAYAMIAWSPNRKTLGSHPIHISWNRSPDDGVVGVLRTDYGRGFAVGATPLRDDRWHHIAVVFIPPDDPENFMEVKQYVDGHLEGEGNLSPSGSDVFNTIDGTPASAGTLWLGCRLGVNTVRTERFRGTIDELFVTDRPLEPQEIIHLMTSNQF